MNAPLNIAVVEDRREDRFFLSIALEQADHPCEVFEFSQAQPALDFLKSPNRPQLDLLLVDIGMPRMDGFEFADAFHQLYPQLKGSAQLYITSSSIDPYDRKRASDHPAVAGFIEKPVETDTLRPILQAAAATA